MKKIMTSREVEMLESIKLALNYLNVCHLANHSGCMIKVEQAQEVLNKAIGNVTIHKCHICNTPMVYDNSLDNWICLSCNP